MPALFSWQGSWLLTTCLCCLIHVIDTRRVITCFPKPLPLHRGACRNGRLKLVTAVNASVRGRCCRPHILSAVTVGALIVTQVLTKSFPTPFDFSESKRMLSTKSEIDDTTTRMLTDVLIKRSSWQMC